MFEFLGFNFAELEHFFLIVARISALFFTLPIINNTAAQPQFKILFSFFIALIVFNFVPVAAHLPVQNIMLVYFVGIEIVTGVTIGMVASVVFEGLTFAGFTIGRMMGLSMLSIIDPTTQEDSNALGQFFKFVIILILFTINAHHFFFDIIFKSFVAIPISNPVFDERILTKFIQMTGQILLYGFKFSAPIAAILFLQKTLLAIFSKVSPDMNVFIIGMPLGLLIGLYSLVNYIPYLNFAFIKYWNLYKSDMIHLLKIIGME